MDGLSIINHFALVATRGRKSKEVQEQIQNTKQHPPQVDCPNVETFGVRQSDAKAEAQSFLATVFGRCLSMSLWLR